MDRADLSPTPLLRMSKISKSWGPLRALDAVELVAYRGEVHALMGENGAGKSTLINILSGVHQPDAGADIVLDGARVAMSSPREARALGISTIHQELALAENLTVFENMFLGNEIARNSLLSRSRMRAEARTILNQLAAPFSPDAVVGSLSLAQRQLVEIGKALLTRAKILVMDEPTTSLSERETRSLFEVIGCLKRDGMGIIYISHRMDEIYALADRVTVLRDGRSVGTLDRAGLDPNTLVRMMVGRDLDAFYHKEHCLDLSTAPVMLEVEDIADDKAVLGCSFTLRSGEVLGLAGLVGAGRTELARLVAAIDPRRRGVVRLDGEILPARDSRAVMQAGLAYLTEDRKGLGLFLEMTVRDNINVNIAARDARLFGIRNLAAAKARSDQAFGRLKIKAASDLVAVGRLSGGNQQKALLARLLAVKPKVLILDEPTRGVDIGAKIEIYKLIDELAATGVAIMVISSEMPELIGIADRLVVMRDGLLLGEIVQTSQKRATQEEVMGMISAVGEGAVP